MEVLDIKNARWIEQENNIFSADVLFDRWAPEYLPFTFHPLDKEPHSIWIRDVWMADETNVESILPELPRPNPETDYSQDQAVANIQNVLDTKARTFGYDNILSAASYATSTSSKFGPEGRAFVAWRDTTWLYAFDLLAQVQGGQIEKPTMTDLLASLPVFPAVDYVNG